MARSNRLTTRAVLSLSALALHGCEGELGASSEHGDAGSVVSQPLCLSDPAYFQREIWGSFMGTTCARCHTPDGPAVQSGAKFVLQPPSYPGWVDENLSTIRELSKFIYVDRPLLLAKPLGKVPHGGGVLFAEGSPEEKKLTELIARLAGKGTRCPDENPLSVVELLSPSETLRKAAIDLAGRLPTSAEEDAVAEGGEAALASLLDGLMREPTFLERVREMYNDMLLTDRGLAYGGAALNFMDENLYPALKPYKDSKDPLSKDPRKGAMNRAIAREPLDLIAYVVAQDRPFSEVLSADYTVVNPYSAAVYGVDPGFADPNDEAEFKEVRLTQSDGNAVPHAGVLSTAAFLNRWQTTPTNRNRARARRVYQFFLATDVLKIAERPVDASKLTAIDNPTLHSEHCNVCHQVIDPLAGAFRGFDSSNYEKFTPTASWHNDMEPPAFGRELLDPAYYGRALQWFGPRLHEDPRFALGVVQAVYTGLTGRKPLVFPTDAQAPNYGARLRAWELQDSFFRAAAAAFRERESNFKVVVQAVVKSPYYRGIGLRGEQAPDESLADLGLGQLLSPESLNRKIAALTGVRWRKTHEWERRHDWLAEDFDIPYGGIDSDSVIERASSPNSVMVAIQSRMASELSCRLTGFEFTRAPAERRLFPLVQLDQVPESAGAPAEPAVAAIKANIQYLHERLLGEKLELGDPELERTYGLYYATWKELETLKAVKLEGECQGRIDPSTGKELQKEQQITEDKSYAIKAWGAVVTYLLSDYRFFHH